MTAPGRPARSVPVEGAVVDGVVPDVLPGLLPCRLVDSAFWQV